MRFFLPTLFTCAALATAQDADQPWHLINGTIKCDRLGEFCVTDTNIRIFCHQIGPGNSAGNCNDELAGVCGHVCQFAECVESTPGAGDGHCEVVTP